MAFKQYDNKSSLDYKNSRLVQGGTCTLDGNFLGYWEKRNLPHDDVTDEAFTITLEFAFRPDKIAYVMYGRSDFQWLVLQYNNIVDIMEELTVGTIIVLPSYARAIYNLTSD